jgi:hypothetical protein
MLEGMDTIQTQFKDDKKYEISFIYENLMLACVPTKFDDDVHKMIAATTVICISANAPTESVIGATDNATATKETEVIGKNKRSSTAQSDAGGSKTYDHNEKIIDSAAAVPATTANGKGTKKPRQCSSH